MPGERWPDKRARAVLYAGARKAIADARPDADAQPDAGATPALGLDPDAVADTGLLVRELLFFDDEVREDTADAKAHRIGYSADCMQFATLEPGGPGLLVSLWVGADAVAEAREALGAEEDPNPFRRLYGWVRIGVAPGAPPPELGAWVERAARHAATTKGQQTQASL